MAINYRDPRYQKAALSATASPLANKLGAQEQVTAQFVTQQQQTANEFAQIGLQKRMHESSLALAEDRLKFQKDSFKTGLKNAKQATNLGILGGLGTTLYAGYIGRQRQQTLEMEAAKKQKVMDKLFAQIEKQNTWYDNTEGVL